jgi:hypothetical protein
MTWWFTLALTLAWLAGGGEADHIEVHLLRLSANTPNGLGSSRDPSCTYDIALSIPGLAAIKGCEANQDLKSGTVLYNRQIYQTDVAGPLAALTATVSLDCSEQNCPSGSDCVFDTDCLGFADTDRQMGVLQFAFLRNAPVERLFSLVNYNVSFLLVWTAPTSAPTLPPPTTSSTAPRSTPPPTTTTPFVAPPSTSTSVIGVVTTGGHDVSPSQSSAMVDDSTDGANADGSGLADDTGTIVGLAVGVSACVIFVVVGAVVLALRSKRSSDEINAVAVKNTSYIFDSARETPASDPQIPDPTPEAINQNTLSRSNNYAVTFATFSGGAAAPVGHNPADGIYSAPLDRKPAAASASEPRDSGNSDSSTRYASARRPTAYAPATELTQVLNKPAF